MDARHLQTAEGCNCTYSVWKATTYVQPARWLYDVVGADGSLIRPGNHEFSRRKGGTMSATHEFHPG